MKNGKVVILGGNARSGKTTLAKRLATNGFNRVSFDTLNSALEQGLKIELGTNSADKLFDFFQSIVNSSLEEAKVDGINTVIDMYDFTPKYLSRLSNINEVETYFLAYPNCSKDEISFNIKYYARATDWIAQVNDEYFNDCVERFYIRNNTLKDECKEYSFQLIDTSCGENRNKSLENLYNQIISTNNLVK